MSIFTSVCEHWQEAPTSVGEHHTGHRFDFRDYTDLREQILCVLYHIIRVLTISAETVLLSQWGENQAEQQIRLANCQRAGRRVR